jgi:hypothetical protein
MPTIDEAYQQLWQAVNPTVPLNTDSGLYKAWLDNYKDWGSPVAGEYAGDDGNTYQAFSHAIVQWASDGPHVQ